MFLNQTAHYALRAMVGLVNAEDNKPVNSKKLAEYSNVPSHYLSKIMRKMVEAGYVKSKKGHGGGFVLNAKPAELNILDVIVASGLEVEELPCVFGYEECGEEDPCPLHPVWKRLKNAFYDWAVNTTFEDIKKENNLINEPKS